MGGWRITEGRLPESERDEMSTVTCVAGQTLANVMVYLVEAGAVVLTRSGGAFVDVNFAAVALKSRHTEATVFVDAVEADGSVLAGVGGALVDLLLAVGTRVASQALAGVRPAVLETGAVVAKLS